MKPFSARRADGSMRNRHSSDHLPSRQRSRRGNGRLVDGRSGRARRLRELVDAFGSGHDLGDEEIAALVRSTASLQVEIEAIEDQIDRREPIDRSVFATMVNTRERSFARLREMRTQVRDRPASSRSEFDVASSPRAKAAREALDAHIRELIAARPKPEAPHD
jgi:hypothetical protein